MPIERNDLYRQTAKIFASWAFRSKTYFYLRRRHIIWLIFNEKILRNTSCFARFQTAAGMRPHKALVFLVFFLLNRGKPLINHPL